MALKDCTYSVWFNLLQVILGSTLSAFALKTIAFPQHFIPGGVFGLSSLVFYQTGVLDIALLYLLFNIPLFIIAWRGISPRFLSYSIVAMLVFTSVYTAIDVEVFIKTQVYAVVACGIMHGLGAGIVLRSLGSNGGLDVLAVWLFQNYNVGVGKFFFVFNALLYLSCLIYIDIDLVIASIIMMFCSSVVMEKTLSLFSQRKVVFIVSDKVDNIASEIQEKLRIGGTLLAGTGVYSRAEKSVLMTVINNIQLKRLEEVVFTIDENALFIVENTFSVLGKSFAKRKIY
ncbi:MAG: YitT family protein [Thermodesulfobacteriota bacterium]